MENISLSRNSEVDLFIKHLVTGAIAGAVSRTATAPLDRLKTFQQVSKVYLKPSKLVIDLYKEGGIRSFWRGNFLNVIKNTPKTAVRFAVYNETKRFTMHHNKTGQLNLNERFVAGCVAGCISQAATYPFEILKVKLNLRKTGQYSGLFDAIRKICKKEGIMSFGRGFVPSMLSVIPYSGLDLAGYEKLKMIGTVWKERSLNAGEKFLAGSLSCFIAQFACYPLMLVTVRMQADVRDTRVHKVTMREVMKNIMAENGVLGFYRGLFLNLAKFIPAMGLTYVAYEEVNKLFSIQMD